MSSELLLTSVLPPLLSGLRGHALPEVEGTSDPLALLALTAAALGLTRPALPPSFESERTDDTRQVVSGRARRLLLELVRDEGENGLPEGVQTFIARELDARRMRPHPFDLSRMEKFVARNAQLLGATAVAFAQKNEAPEVRRGYFDVATLDPSNWNYGNRRQRSDYLQRLRREDPEQGRTLLESVWQSEDPETRFRLISAMREALSADDADFLKTAARDRSPRVKAVAMALLARLPGHAGDNPVLREVVGRIQTRGNGLKLERPANVHWHDFSGWVADAFSNFGLSSLAQALSMDPDAAINAARADEHLLAGLLVSATVDQNLDAVGRIARVHLPTMGDFPVVTPIPATDYLSEQERLLWVDAVALPDNFSQTTLAAVVAGLSRLAEGALPGTTAERLLVSPWLRRSLSAAGREKFSLAELVTLMPNSARGRLGSLFLDVFGPAYHGSEAFTLIEFLYELETDNG